MEWGDADTQGMYAPEPMAHLEVSVVESKRVNRLLKHDTGPWTRYRPETFTELGKRWADAG